ncbi:MAG: LacI family DNA-binding transcriptional regulator [Pseudomonadota bacterium]
MRNRPKLQDVANRAGVSVATASQVLRGTGRISENTRKRVQEAAQKLHYVPDDRAVSMRSGAKKEIGMIIQRIANPFNAEVISGVSDLLESKGYLVSILDSQDDLDRQRRNLEAFIRNSRGGLIWVPSQDTPQSVADLLHAHQLPVVTFLRKFAFGTFDHVGIENRRAIETATQHLVSLGHSKIAYFGGEADVDVRQERIRGYTNIMKANGLGAPIIWDAADDKLAGMNAMLALHKERPDITGLVCNGDVVALGACHAMQKLGLLPGQDISVIGFDDIQDAGLATPSLSTMAVRPYQLGHLLAQTILTRLNEPNLPVNSTYIAATLVARETTGKLLA